MNGKGYCKMLLRNVSNENCLERQRNNINTKDAVDGKLEMLYRHIQKLRFWDKLRWEVAKLLTLRLFNKRLDGI